MTPPEISRAVQRLRSQSKKAIGQLLCGHCHNCPPGGGVDGCDGRKGISRSCRVGVLGVVEAVGTEGWCNTNDLQIVVKVAEFRTFDYPEPWLEGISR